MLRLPAALGVTPQWLLAGEEPKRPGGSVEAHRALIGARIGALIEVIDLVQALLSKSVDAEILSRPEGAQGAGAIAALRRVAEASSQPYAAEKPAPRRGRESKG
ncbi:MAG TPA: hypothetical protein VJN95_08850 [Gemmatimonadales bacterium]|nr:hypothetical protein [Gemmatimonadales bacterium]